MSDKSDCDVVPTEQRLIEKQLMVALEDGSKAALILGKDDLLELISALRICRPNDKRLSMTRDLVQLYRVTFGGEP